MNRAPSAVPGGHTPQRPDEANAAWSAVGRLVAGPLLYGGLGYLLDRWLGTFPALMATGVILGFVAGIYLVIRTSDGEAARAAAQPTSTSRSRAAAPKGTREENNGGQ